MFPRKTKWIICAFVIILIGCGKKQQESSAPPEVPFVQILQKDVSLTREYVGQTYGENDIEIRARVQGWLTGMYFKEGSEVKKGQLLYTIDPLPYQTKVDQSKGDLAEADAELAKAQSDYDRIKPLTDKNAVSQRELVAAEASLKAAKAKKMASQAGLENSGIELGYARINAPIDGVIGITKAQVGDFVGGALIPLNTISNVKNIRVRFSVSESEYLQYRKQLETGGGALNTSADLILADGSLLGAKGQINLANREVDPTTGTLTLQATFPNPNQLIRPGQYGRVRFIIKELKNAMLIPQRAITELQGIYQVFVVDGENKISVKVIEVGERYGDYWIVMKGLEPGDKIILGGNLGIRSKMVVTPVPAAPQP